MVRLLVCLVLFLPVCLALQDQSQDKDNGHSSYDSPPPHGDGSPIVRLEGLPLLRQHCVASLLGNTSSPFPGTLPWSPLQHISDKRVETLFYQHLFCERPWEF